MTDVMEYEAQEQKPYVTSVERIATQRGLERGLQGIQEMLVEVLQTRFDAVPEDLVARLEQIADIETLKALHRHALLAESLDAFARQLAD